MFGECTLSHSKGTSCEGVCLGRGKKKCSIKTRLQAWARPNPSFLSKVSRLGFAGKSIKLGIGPAERALPRLWDSVLYNAKPMLHLPSPCYECQARATHAKFIPQGSSSNGRESLNLKPTS
eukprot:936305-Pelagomonas_calceolata.AAC.3